MGRWGWRLFEADRDLDILGDMLGHTGQSEEAWTWTLEDTILGPDYDTPTEVRSKLDNEVLPYVRQRFDTDDLGEQMLVACRAKEGEDMPFNPTKYTTILMGALIMRAGGQISSESMQHLRALVPQVNCNARFVLPLNDEGFRSPGRAQFLAALDHYRAGVPRSFRSPR
ncbi:hypothetical protein BO86DRAFT_396906 [Aspergillus japonicus CBS 114.51]|uniref:Uncharacterized protein n=1 Tax=Aspergillus japonicus CBS 114.51 TaxID=1448312 RepID=A0A8T8X937_ASPJA|nr:hypothetical protein BO86DRAFT_396906 [Aspergillus japonicus CBS 114.51]RAH84656.1 hypothetical protein BO86DRAFT_396906 [Aspergillus japonicus CBS 114.51]